jgi:cell shape-determining protein MreC
MKNFSLKTRGNYLPDSKAKRFFKHIALIAVIFSVLFFGTRLIAKVTQIVTVPIYRIQNYMAHSSATIPVFVRSRTDLLATIQELEQKIASQEGMRDTLTLVTEENKELRAHLNATRTPRIAAGVIAQPPHTPYDTVILDRGSDDGIVKDAPVYYSSGKTWIYSYCLFSHITCHPIFFA